MHQAIETKYLSYTNTKPSRIKAVCNAGSIIVSYDHGLNTDENHKAAANALVQAMAAKCLAEYNDPMAWRGLWVGGATRAGYVFCRATRRNGEMDPNAAFEL